MQTIAVAAMSARALAESAARDGFNVVALDLFGDVDTRRVAARWLPIGAPGSLQIEPASVLAALRQVVHEGRHGAPLLGWVAGSGFEGDAALLEQGAGLLPLIGTAPTAVRRLRDPAAFFGFLGAQGMPFAPVTLQPPADPTGWLMKDAHGCGCWQVQRAPWPGEPAPAASRRYYQREMAGQPMSATFIANGREVQVLGFNAQNVRGIGTRPFVFCGVIGPVPVPPALARQVTAIARAVTVHFGLRGVCSLDFMRDGDAIGVLEVNPRPPASMGLYHGAAGVPDLMRAHVQACLYGALPPVPAPAAQVAGFETVYARRPLALDAAALRRLAAWPGIHDIPQPDQHFGIGEPLCTLSAHGGDVQQVRHQLATGCEALLQSLENTP